MSGRLPGLNVFRNNSGNLAMFTAILRASFLLSNLAQSAEDAACKSVGLTRPSVAMPARRPTIHWLTRESTSVYGRKRYL
jgi:hypothetical protein